MLRSKPGAKCMMALFVQSPKFHSCGTTTLIHTLQNVYHFWRFKHIVQDFTCYLRKNSYLLFISSNEQREVVITIRFKILLCFKWITWLYMCISQHRIALSLKKWSLKKNSSPQKRLQKSPITWWIFFASLMPLPSCNQTMTANLSVP